MCVSVYLVYVVDYIVESVDNDVTVVVIVVAIVVVCYGDVGNIVIIVGKVFGRISLVGDSW